MKKTTKTPADCEALLQGFGLALEDFPDARIQEYRRGEYLCRQGLPMRDLLFVVEGRVKVCAVTPEEKTLLFCYNGPGAMLGEVELMTGEAASSTLQAAGPVRCLAIPLDKYRQQLRGNPAFMERVALMLARIVARYSINDSFNILAPLETRLRAYIALNSPEGLFASRLTETAEYLGVSYRHLLRTMNELCAGGELEKTEGGYRISDPAAFARVLEDGAWSSQSEK